MISLYRTALEAVGCTVTTVAEPHPFYLDDFTHSLQTPNWLFRPIRSTSFYPFEKLRRQLVKLRLLSRPLQEWLLYLKYRDHLDILLIVGDGLVRRDLTDFRYLKQRGVRIGQAFFGGDVRDWQTFKQQFGVDLSSVTDREIDNRNFNEIVFRLRKAELYADALFSLPDQMGLAIRPYFKLDVPFSLSGGMVKPRGRAIPKVVHIESQKPYKGEPYIYAAVERLKQDSESFEFRSYKCLSHEEVLAVLRDADILVDETMIFGPGILGHEAVACGCALATKMQPEHAMCNYVCNIQDDDIVEPLRVLIRDRDTRVRNSLICQELLNANLSPAAVGRKILQCLGFNETSTFEPEKLIEPHFFVDEYIRPIGHELNDRNKMLTLEVAKKHGVSEDRINRLRVQGMI